MQIRPEEELQVLVCNRGGFGILMCAPEEGNRDIRRRKKKSMVFTIRKLYSDKQYSSCKHINILQK